MTGGLSLTDASRVNSRLPPWQHAEPLPSAMNDAKARTNLKTANRIAGWVEAICLDNASSSQDAAELVMQTAGGVELLLPFMALDASELQRFGSEIDDARRLGFFVMVKQLNGQLRGTIGKEARSKLRKNKDDFPLLVCMLDRFKEAQDADPQRMKPWLADEPTLLLREIPANTHSTPGSIALHCDWEHSPQDPRLLTHFDQETLEEHLASSDVAVLARNVHTIGAATKTLFADIKGRSLLTAQVPCVGGGVCIHGAQRAINKGVVNRLLHAGASDGMPLRWQIVPDWAVFSQSVWNRVMANFLLQDVMGHPVLDTVGNDAHAELVDSLTALALS